MKLDRNTATKVMIMLVTRTFTLFAAVAFPSSGGNGKVSLAMGATVPLDEGFKGVNEVTMY